jgi:hypothetical protein
MTRYFSTLLLFVFSCTVGAVDFRGIKSSTDLETLISFEANSEVRSVLRDHAGEILKAATRHSHVEAVIAAVALSPGNVVEINLTPDDLKKATGGEIGIFQSLTLVDLAIPNAGPHDHRESDPYDADFFRHLGEIDTLESVNIIATKASDDWIAPLGKLTGLKSLKFTNNGKLTDAGLAHLAGLKNLEAFSFVGTGITGRAYSGFEGWDKLIKCSHRGSSIDDEGLKQLCDHLPHLESLSLAHAKFTDEGAPHLAKLTHLKGLELGTSNASSESLRALTGLSLESLQLGEGFESPGCFPLVKKIATLRRLTLTNAGKLTDADFESLAGLTQLEHLELGKLELTPERLPALRHFSFLKSMRLVPAKGPFPEEIQAKITALLPNTILQYR